jgi:hypothetical protein
LKNFVRQIFRVEPKCGAAGWDCQVRQETSSASLGPPQSPVLSGGRGFSFGPHPYTLMGVSQANVCRGLSRRILIAIDTKHEKSNS